MAYFWPLILVVASNSVYHICAKSLPESVDPLASLTVTYLIGSIFSGILYFVTNRGGAYATPGTTARRSWTGRPAAAA